MKSSLEIAQEAVLRPIAEVASEAGLLDDEVEQYGRYKAKIDLGVLDRLADRPDGKIICVTAVTPTSAGEGKTTTSVSLTQGFGKIGESVALCLRQASLGPVFGVKGGAAGAGHAQVVPMEDLNLHFTGDLHAITAANNLLAAFIDAHVMHGNELDIDVHTIGWRRALDMNDRGLRNIVTRPRRRDERLPARDGLRHHRRLRGDGDPRARLRPARPAHAPRRDHRRLHTRPASPSRPSRSAAPARWRCC